MWAPQLQEATRADRRKRTFYSGTKYITSSTFNQPCLFMTTIKSVIFTNLQGAVGTLKVWSEFVFLTMLFVWVCSSSVTTRLFVVPQEYGGYVTSLLVSGEESPVKCGAVLSPITDFELYGELCLFALHSLLYVVNKYLCIIIQAQEESIQKRGKRQDGDCRSGTFHPCSWELFQWLCYTCMC